MTWADPKTRNSLLLRLHNPKDVAAWDEFASSYGPVIYRVAIGRGLSTEDAEDSVQEVFMAVAKSLSAWLDRRNRGPFCAWLIRVARNEAIDCLTRRTVFPTGCVGSAAEHLLTNLPDRAELSDSLDLEFERGLFRRAAEKVREETTEQVWLAFWLTNIEGLTVAQTAAKLGTTLGNIYVARSRVMRRLKEQVDLLREPT